MIGNVVYQGRRRRIECAVRPNGQMPALDFYKSLPLKEQAKLDFLFRLLGEEGQIWNKHRFKKLGGHIWEFKRDQIRMLCFFGEEGTVILSHGFRKKSPRTPRGEIERASRIRDEHLGRRRENG